MIDYYIPYIGSELTKIRIDSLSKESCIDSVFTLSSQSIEEFATNISAIGLESTEMLKKIANSGTSEYLFYSPAFCNIEWGQHAIDRMNKIAQESGAAILYADYYKEKDNEIFPIPTNEYQLGSVRDDFNFGPVVLLNRELLRKVLADTEEYETAGWYRIRLALSTLGEVVHIDEFLYTEKDISKGMAGERQFDYVDPRNRASQIEKEQAFTSHLKRINAYLPPKFENIHFDEQDFPCEASVIIPVRNRVRTIKDAIHSVLSQKTNFPFNLIIIDNHSTDGTSDIIETCAKSDSRIIHIRPSRTDLGIGGCWNEGIDSPHCGKFAVQLDSDDIYETENTLQKIVDAFYEQQCGMVIGSYTLTDFQMNILPPGLIDHKEWTPENGRNNALRINGLGAPRAFYTPLLRKIHIPNTSYGEDYALGLSISHNYQIGRIFESLYLCRRWEGNSDAALDIFKTNKNNHYKDKLRTLEILRRQKEAKSWN